jgi:hypothetical protein
MTNPTSGDAPDPYRPQQPYDPTTPYNPAPGSSGGQPQPYGETPASGQPNPYGPPDPYGRPDQYGEPNQYGQPAPYVQADPYGQPEAYGQAPYAQAPYQAPYGGYVPAQQRTNGLAIASLVCSLAGLVTCISAPVGIVLGHLAKHQIRQTGEQGESLATAGLWVGYIVTVLAIVVTVGWVAIVLLAFGDNTGAAGTITT